MSFAASAAGTCWRGGPRSASAKAISLGGESGRRLFNHAAACRARPIMFTHDLCAWLYARVWFGCSEMYASQWTLTQRASGDLQPVSPHNTARIALQVSARVVHRAS